MTRVDLAAMGDSLLALKERKRLLDDVWLLTLLVIFVAVGLPWYLRLLEIDFAPVAWSLFTYGLLYLAISFAADALRTGRSLLIVIGALQAAGVLFIGFVWHLTGSLQNPMFLLLFVIPVIAGSFILVSWQSYAAALLSVATVATVALLDAPELRWYVAQAGLPASWLVNLLTKFSANTRQPFSGINTPPSYLFVLLLSFAVLLFTVALMTGSLTSLLLRLYGRLQSSTSALEQAGSLSSELLRASPSPAALVYADTFKIAQASQSFMHHLLLQPESLLDKNLFGLIEFDYPEVIEELIAGKGGEVPLAAYRVESERRLARVQISLIKHGGLHYAYVNLQDISDLQYLKAALDVVNDALIVIGGSQQILYFNDAAKNLFGDLQVGMNAAVPLRQADLPEGWWELGARSRQRRKVEIASKSYAVNCVAARITGERDALTVVSLQSAGSGE